MPARFILACFAPSESFSALKLSASFENSPLSLRPDAEKLPAVPNLRSAAETVPLLRDTVFPLFSAESFSGSWTFFSEYDTSLPESRTEISAAETI